MKGFLVCVIGRPAAGKTSIAQRTRRLLAESGLAAEYVTDHGFFMDALHSPDMRGRMEPFGDDFLIKDVSVLDDILVPVSGHVRGLLSRAPVVLLDFSRPNYCYTFDRLAELGCKPGLAVYLSTTVETALRRNEQRPANGGHYVPAEAILKNCASDDLSDLRKRRELEVMVIPNDSDGEADAMRAAQQIAEQVRAGIAKK